jgi:hypothetical protein
MHISKFVGNLNIIMEKIGRQYMDLINKASSVSNRASYFKNSIL